MREETLLAAIRSDPWDGLAYQALADWLEEDGQGERGELVRLMRRLYALPVMKRTKQRAALEDRLAALLQAGVRPVVPEVVNSLGMRLALIPPGRFRMGSPRNEPGRSSDEHAHEVEISRPFYLGVFPVTQAQYQAVVGANPSHFSAGGGGKEQVKGLDTRDFPVENLSWDEAVEFCRRLSELPEEKRSGRLYRLPTEAEWEYSCRGGPGSTTPFHFGHSLSPTQANFNGHYPYGGAEKGPCLGRTSAAGSYPANARGLRDMHGNVWECCADWYDEGYYEQSPGQDPPGPSGGPDRVIRGGSWDDYGWYCRSAFRYRDTPGYRINIVGFRVALVPSGG